MCAYRTNHEAKRCAADGVGVCAYACACARARMCMTSGQIEEEGAAGNEPSGEKEGGGGFGSREGDEVRSEARRVSTRLDASESCRWGN